MKFQFEEFDFCGENAARTASVMRAIADAVSPQSAGEVVLATATPAQVSEVLRSFGKSVPVASLTPLAEAMVNAGTVATHVSAAAVGDVPFAPADDAEAFFASAASAPTEDFNAIRITAEAAGKAPAVDVVVPLGGVDAEGYPWDERIHAGSRATVADGTWRKKRGVDEALVAEVRAEWDAKLRSAVPAPPTEAERLQADHVATMAPPPPPAAIDPASVGFGAAPIPAADAWPDDILGPRTDAAAPFPQFMAYVGKRIGSGELDNVRLLAVLNEHGVPLLPALSAPEHVGKIPAIARQLAEV